MLKKKNRWKVRTTWFRSKRYLGVKPEKLTPIKAHWRPMNNNDDTNASKKDKTDRRPSWTVKPRLGDRVQIIDGKVGIVRYVGYHEFDKGYDRDTYIGLQLEKWDINAHNGTVDGKQYYHTEPGYGYFVRLSDIVKNDTLQKTIQLKLESAEPLTEFPKLNDIVVTDKGKVGVCRYIGTTSFGLGIHIGLELSEYDENAHDGSVQNQRYFQCQMGYDCRSITKSNL